MKNKRTYSIVAVAALLFYGSGSAAMAGHDGNIGADVYSQTCVACHGEDGKGTIPGVPDLTDTEGRLLKSDAALIESITDGFESPGSFMAMPPKGGNEDLTDEEIQSVLHFIREDFGSGKTRNPVE